ncbi:MAG: hypothetical protein A2622_11235 [Bdellovibrionales bacterium RIFCSPHIGHO2_01_FULL_40_29]|nr:MAG: hypothetical protein A2622_11235 [Bdellovibrionales bacterium RIFCSPHIGHO2_01_FULL_40_29]OFZ34524.1 MAG: hypothetical protein A3D17_01500 [Bdellovibrionales bacterium RIFCSPHIGHO2_02_FULL_40_15]
MTKFISVLAASLILLSACGKDSSKPNIEVIQDMMESPAIKAQEYDESSPNHSGMRVPPEGTQPVGFTPYRYGADFAASAKNKNPLSNDFSEETLKVGLKFYQTNCMLCHGAQGEGGAKLSMGPKMPLVPPPVISDRVTQWTDGQIYHVITMGQGVMGPYASHIPQKYRWQVVNYIRHLQKESK